MIKIDIQCDRLNHKIIINLHFQLEMALFSKFRSTVNNLFDGYFLKIFSNQKIIFQHFFKNQIEKLVHEF